MTPEQLAAYIGAAAWAPQIATWIYNAVAKPKLTIVSASTVEIGFTFFGPILNTTLAISSERRDALIEGLTLHITHERGEKRQLIWRHLSENQQQLRDAQGNISQFIKNNPAVALKVSTLALTEKTVGFQDPDYEVAYRASARRIADQFSHLTAQNDNATALAALLRSLEFEQVQRAFENYMYWKAGRYEFALLAQIAGVKKPHEQLFTVTLLESDIATLRRNLELLVPYVRSSLSTDPADQKLINWNWIYPGISASQKSTPESTPLRKTANA